MELALYHPELGYYSRAARRSGRDGDFFTSVDVGPLFGELIAAELDEMWQVLRASGAGGFDLVEAGAGDGRLARDVLDAAARDHPDFYANVRLTLVERSPAARDAQRATLGPHLERLVAVREDLPPSVEGVIYANELLDAFPVHVVTMTVDGDSRDCRVRARRCPCGSGSRDLRSSDRGTSAAARRRAPERRSVWRPRPGSAAPPPRCDAGSCCSSTTGTNSARSIRARIPRAP